jgi:hypothetical protein
LRRPHTSLSSPGAATSPSPPDLTGGRSIVPPRTGLGEKELATSVGSRSAAPTPGAGRSAAELSVSAVACPMRCLFAGRTERNRVVFLDELEKSDGGLASKSFDLSKECPVEGRHRSDRGGEGVAVRIRQAFGE